MSSLTADECLALEEQQILLPSDVRSSKKRKISASYFLTPPHSSSTGSSSGSSSASISYHVRSNPPPDDIEFAPDLKSAEALEFAGFQPMTAQVVFEDWLGRPDPEINPDSLVDYACAHVKQVDDVKHLSDTAILAHIGIAHWLSKAILDPEFEDIYRTETLQFWVESSVNANYISLTRIHDDLRSLARAHTSKKSGRQRRGNLPEFNNENPAPAEQATERIATMNIADSSDRLSQVHVKVQEASPPLPNHVVLYKGKAVAEITALGSIIDDEGNIDLGPLQSDNRGDFNSRVAGWYWTKDEQVAEKYRKYAEQRCKTSETWIICIQIPTSLTGSFDVEETHFGDEFKEFVWRCRRGMSLPPKFDRLTKDADVIIGPICQIANPEIRGRANLQDVLRTFTLEDVMKVPGTNRKASQWVVLKSNIIHDIGRHIRGKMHIERFSAVKKNENK